MKISPGEYRCASNIKKNSCASSLWGGGGGNPGCQLKEPEQSFCSVSLVSKQSRPLESINKPKTVQWGGSKARSLQTSSQPLGSPEWGSGGSAAAVLSIFFMPPKQSWDKKEEICTLKNTHNSLALGFCAPHPMLCHVWVLSFTSNVSLLQG